MVGREHVHVIDQSIVEVPSTSIVDNDVNVSSYTTLLEYPVYAVHTSPGLEITTCRCSRYACLVSNFVFFVQYIQMPFLTPIRDTIWLLLFSAPSATRSFVCGSPLAASTFSLGLRATALLLHLDGG